MTKTKNNETIDSTRTNVRFHYDISTQREMTYFIGWKRERARQPSNRLNGVSTVERKMWKCARVCVYVCNGISLLAKNRSWKSYFGCVSVLALVHARPRNHFYAWAEERWSWHGARGYTFTKKRTTNGCLNGKWCTTNAATSDRPERKTERA